MPLSVTVMVVWDGTTITVENYYEPHSPDAYAKIDDATGLLGDAHHRALAAVEAIYKGD